MITLSAPRPVVSSGFAPAGPPRRDAVDRVAVVGQVFRGGIRQLAAFDDRLLALVGRGITWIDPATAEPVETRLASIAIDHLIVAGDRLFVRVGAAIHPVDLDTWTLGAIAATLPQQCQSVAGGAGVIAWPHHDGVEVLCVADGTRRVLAADPALLGEGTWRKTTDRVAVSPNGAWVAAWKQGDARTIWSTADGSIARQSTWQTDALVVLDDGRVAVTHYNAHRLIAGTDPAEAPSVHREGQVIAAPGGLAIVDRFGGHARVSLDPFAITHAVEGAPGHYGSMPAEGIAVITDAWSAGYAESHGALFVTQGATTRRTDDWLAHPEDVSIAATGTRLVVESKWREEGVVVDLAAGTVQIAEGAGGMSGPGISADGETLFVPAGDCLGPRTVCGQRFAAGAEPEVLFKIRPWCCGIVGVLPDLFVVGTYSLRSAGYVGIYREGRSRALMKLRHGSARPYRFTVNADATRCVVDWRDASTLHDLTARGRTLATLERHIAVALGRTRVALVVADGERRTLIIRDGEAETRADLGLPRHHWGRQHLAFSADESLIFVGRADGDVEVRATADGALLRAMPLHAGRLVALTTRAGLVWSLGTDGRLCALGVPGEAALSEAPAEVELAEEAPEALPTQRPWGLDLPVLRFNLGSREIEAALVDGVAQITDAQGKPVGSIRKRKGDHAIFLKAAQAHRAVLRDFEKRPAEAWRQVLRNAFLDGRSATAGELAGDPSGALEGTVWVTITGRKRLFRYTDGALPEAAPDLRVRLAHPTKVSRRSLSRSPNRERPVHAVSNPEYRTAVPVETDWASTQNPTVGRLLELRGFVRHLDSERATCAWHLPAPELGAVAVVGLDEEHGGSELTFYAWNGTLDGGEQLALAAVDPQLYAEAYQAVIDAYPYD